MNWLRKKDELARQLSPDVARFVLQTLKSLEQENIFDAPSMISGVLQHMRVADSDAIRRAARRTETALKRTLGGGYGRQQIGA